MTRDVIGDERHFVDEGALPVYRRSMDIRPLSITDFNRLTKTFVRAYPDSWSEDVARRYLVKFFHFEPESCLAAIKDGQLIGAILGYSYLKQENLVMFIQELFVDPDFRKTGCGTELVKALRRSFSSSKAVEVTPMVKGDTRVLNFYNSLGFEQPTSMAFIVDADDDD